MELGSGLFYQYVVVDIPLLISNFTACEPKTWRLQESTDAEAVLKPLLRAIATVTPGAKLGATAPYVSADFTLLESGLEQPRSLANAFLRSLQFNNGDDPMQKSVDTLAAHLQAVDNMYGATANQRVSSTIKNGEGLGSIPIKPLDDAIDDTLNTIFQD
jgi:CRISPR system Cascade subunit CasC